MYIIEVFTGATSMLPRFCWVAFVALAGPLSAQATRPDPSRIERGLRPLVRVAGREDTTFDIRDRMRQYHVPGLSIAVIDGDRVVWARAYGVREFGKSEPVDTSTLFLAGSISKPVFASGVLALVEQGKLSLDEDINLKLRSWKLPDSRFTATEKVTLRRLLTHSAGLTVWGFPGYPVSGPVPTVPQLLDGVKPANTAAVRNDTTPGAFWRYSGGGITIAQLMSTDVTGESFPVLMQRLVLRPAGMLHSTFENPPPANLSRYAASGHERVDTPVPGRFHVYPEMAAAGLWTTAPELARWGIAMSRAWKGERVGPLSPVMTRQMLTAQVKLAPPYGSPNGSWWGLGVEVQGEGDSLRFSHGGRDEGFVAQFVMWPAPGRGLVVMMNGVNGGLMGEISRAFDAEYGTRLSPPRLDKVVTTVDSATLGGYAGRYFLQASPDSVFLDIRQEGSTLYGRNTQSRIERALLPQAPDSFFDRETGSEWSFERNATTREVEALIRVIGANRTRVVRQR
jgi:CubicO group peptidase (beta-lactamase class C family)